MSSPADAPRRAECFRYDGFDIDERAGDVRCRYSLDGRRFEEVIGLGGGRDWRVPGAEEAARLVALLAGVSYYKAGAPPVIDLGDTPVRPGETAFLAAFYRDGLGEFAFRNRLSLDDLVVTGGVPAAPSPAAAAPAGRPLIPFGGGLDSIVTVELVRPSQPDAALFVLSRAGDEFAVIERAAAVTGLPIVRAERSLDPQILRSAELGFLNGHVPVTGVLSAIAVLAAVLDRRGAVIMSNEWSASAANLVVDGTAVNHQYSKSLAFEDGFRGVLAEAVGPALDYFSALRPFTELWIAQRFAALTEYHPVVHSCNRAFHIDRDQRQAEWCGVCDKCCFIDLILSPFLAPAQLAAIFSGREPLENPALLEQFRTLLGLDGVKPFECVGDVDECRAAAVLAAGRDDRRGSAVLAALVAALGDAARGVQADLPRLLAPIGPHHIPDALLPAAALG